MTLGTNGKYLGRIGNVLIGHEADLSTSCAMVLTFLPSHFQPPIQPYNLLQKLGAPYRAVKGQEELQEGGKEREVSSYPV